MKQCFVGKSRFDTPSWYTTDYQYKRYTKPMPADATSKTERGMSEPYLRSVKHLLWSFFVKMVNGEKKIYSKKPHYRCLQVPRALLYDI